ncbi:hypothetical protein AX16_002933 [Volvariella volvacea WC 439]|nr:hypothetical protein AX16_002933 [Volvariella volvacea WC 439]
MRLLSLFSCCFSKGLKNIHSDDDTIPRPNSYPPNNTVNTNITANGTLPTDSRLSTPIIPGSNTGFRTEPYSKQGALALFKLYADPDDPEVIATEGFERLCKDAGLAMEGALPLILSFMMDAHEMGKITKKEWESGTEAVRPLSMFLLSVIVRLLFLRVSSIPPLALAINDLDKLLFQGQTLPKESGTRDLYDKRDYWLHASNPRTAFHKLYTFCFGLVKPENARVIETEACLSVALWSVLLVPKYPLMAEVLEYITEKEGKYKATNKDLWAMMLEFCETVPSLESYNEDDSSWPTLIDEFVAWKKEKQQ